MLRWDSSPAPRKFFTHATPTLFNAGTPHPQMSSCFLLKMQGDSIDGIYDTLKLCAVISKSAGGIGVAAPWLRLTPPQGRPRAQIGQQLHLVNRPVLKDKHQSNPCQKPTPYCFYPQLMESQTRTRSFQILARIPGRPVEFFVIVRSFKSSYDLGTFPLNTMFFCT